MPPRIPGPQGLKVFSLCLRPAVKPSIPSFQPLIQTANISQKEKKRRMKQDPYRWAQAQQRKTVNVKRKEEMQAGRDEAWGDPVHGITTPFVESFDSAGQAPFSKPPTDEDGNALEEPHALPTSPHILNHLLSKQELVETIELSYLLTKPADAADRSRVDPQAEAAEQARHAADHARAVEALQRITDLNNASSKDRLHANVRRCVETFGRHNTDLALRQKPLARGQQERAAVPRAGPDTGSSEVQIAILTAKIRKLAQMKEAKKGEKDKANKRNLRLLCHRRQRLLRYMERRERGSERWTHMLETLGLSPATWKEQISI